jgi:hypothetical protein
MQSFKLKQDALKKVRKKLLIFLIPALLVYLIVLPIAMGVFSDLSGFQFGWSFELMLPLAIMILFMGFTIYSGFRFFNKIKRIYETYELQISDNLIGREQADTPTISIYFKDVQEIVKRRNGNFMVRGAAATDVILISKHVENYEQLEAALAQIRPIASKSQTTPLYMIQLVLGLITVGLMVCIINVNNKIIIGLAALSLTGVTIYNFIQTRRNKNVDYRTKRFRWFSFVVLLLFLYIAYQKLTAPELPKLYEAYLYKTNSRYGIQP